MAARMRRHGPTGNDSMTNSEITGGQTRATTSAGENPGGDESVSPRPGEAGRSTAKTRGRLLSWQLGVATLAVLALLAASLLTGVYDIFGAADGAEMFQITRIPRTVRTATSAGPPVTAIPTPRTAARVSASPAGP